MTETGRQRPIDRRAQRTGRFPYRRPGPVRAARHRPDADHRSASSCCCSSSTSVWITNFFAHREAGPGAQRPRTAVGPRRRSPCGPADLPGSTQSTISGRRRHREPVYASARLATTGSRSCRASTARRSRRARATIQRRQLPGQLGNFAVAGHRVGKGEPFLNLDQLRAGDAVVVETKSHLVRLPGGGRPRDRRPDGGRRRTGCPGRRDRRADRRRGHRSGARAVRIRDRPRR